MSTLEYLDDQGSVRSFGLVPWSTLHSWLSGLNGHPDHQSLPRGANRGKIIEELEARRKRLDGGGLIDTDLRILNMDRGHGKDWREYENEEGFTHLEELLMFQPVDWRKQAREYLFRFSCDLSRESSNEELRTLTVIVRENRRQIFMKSPILIVLFHPGMTRTSRYEPLNFLLAYGVQDPLPAVMNDLPDFDKEALMEDISPLDYFLEFQNHVESYRLDLLRKIGKEASLPRICLIKELDFSNIIGQRLAKKLIRQSVVNHVSKKANSKGKSMCNSSKYPLSMIFAGPSGNGKTELADWLAKLMNKPNDDFFIKVDCGKLTDASEVFGKSGAYQGAQQGSVLNNFVLKMSLEPHAIGIVLLDEVEKASRDVIHALYQVIDKGEWTNKRLGSRHQTDIIPCHNLVFIMTTNSCDIHISEYVNQHPEIYNAVGDDLEELGSEISRRIRGTLQFMYPFTEAFLGRVGRIVPFLPLATGDPDLEGIMQGESLTVAKLLIERQQEQYSFESSIVDVKQAVSAKEKDRIAKIVVKDAIREAGVRAIQKGVDEKMGDRIPNSFIISSDDSDFVNDINDDIERSNDIDVNNDNEGTDDGIRNDINATDDGIENDINNDEENNDVEDETIGRRVSQRRQRNRNRNDTIGRRVRERNQQRRQ